MKTKRSPVSELLISLLSCTCTGIVLLSGCAPAVHSQRAIIVPYFPPSYYSCIETTVNDLINNYFISERNDEVIWFSEDNYNGKIFVFKNVTISAIDIKSATPQYIWIAGRIKCFGLVQGSTSALKQGDVVDVVGVDAGINQEHSGSLTFNGCVFLPAGSVQLPAVPNTLGATSIY